MCRIRGSFNKGNSMQLNRVLLIASALLLLLAPTGCKRRKRRDPQPEPVVVDVHEPAPVGIASEPCDSEARAHHWIYYPDEPLYFCDRHRHHWIPDGVGGWAHIHEYDAGRPNYAAPILSNQGEFLIFENHATHSATYPPGSRR